MKVTVFRASTDKSLYGFTPIADGSNLPPLDNGGTWTYFKALDLLSGQPNIAVDPDEALAAIEAQGYFLTGAKVKVTEIVGVPKPA
jgi:hypothetical protein